MTDPPLDRRVARTRARVLQAAQEVLLEHGFEAVTIEHISERSGVARSTLYRHWDTREEILRDAFSHVALDAQPAGPDLEADLRRYLATFAVGLTTSWGKAAATMAASALDDPEQRRAIDTFRDGYVADVARILERARERGEALREDADAAATADELTAPLFYRFLISGQPLDDDLLDGLAHQAAYRAQSREAEGSTA